MIQNIKLIWKQVWKKRLTSADIHHRNRILGWSAKNNNIIQQTRWWRCTKSEKESHYIKHPTSCKKNLGCNIQKGQYLHKFYVKCQMGFDLSLTMTRDLTSCHVWSQYQMRHINGMPLELSKKNYASQHSHKHTCKIIQLEGRNTSIIITLIL